MTMVEHACISMLVVHLSISPVLLLIDCESLIACLNSGCYASVVLQRMDACCILQNSLTSILKGLSRPGLLQLPLTPNGYTCKQVGKDETCQCMIVVNDEMVTAKFCSFLMVLQHMDACCILQNSLTSILKGLCCPGLLKLPLTPNGTHANIME